jgi:hypothetical protein
MLDAKIARVKTLIAQREEIDAELAQLLAGTLERKPKKCTRCGGQGHTARNCPEAEAGESPEPPAA